MKERKALASIYITNTTAVIITDINATNEIVTYYVSVVDDEQTPKRHHAKLYYTRKNNEPYFNSVLGRMHLLQAMRVPTF